MQASQRIRRATLPVDIAVVSRTTAIMLLGAVAACGTGQAADYRVETVAEGFSAPWGMVWLPNGDMLITDRDGDLVRVDTGGAQHPVAGLPDIHVNGQGGLLDIELHPDYAQNGWLYLSYSSPSGDGDGSNTAVARAKLDGNTLVDVQVLYKAVPNTRRGQHYGSRLEFDDDGFLYFSIGDRGNRDVNPQDLARDGGKVYRIHDDGRIPADNPFVGRAGAIAAAYSLGHRNPQGMARHPTTGLIWTHEHGPRGGDEVNVIAAGQNYGWPILSYGVNYSGTPFAEGTEREGFVSPVWHWVPSIAPSGMTFVTSDRYPDWRGHLLVGSLRFNYVVLCRVDGDTVTQQEIVLENIGRVRNIRQGPDGLIYVALDDKGVVRVLPPSSAS